MANKSLTDLTARTATADSDLIHVNSGGTDYKETKANFLSNITSSISSINSSLANTSLKYSDHTYTGTFTPNSSGYVKLGSIPTDFGVSINNYFVGFLIRGWSGGQGALTLAIGSNGTDLYLLSSSTTSVTSINIRMWYVPTAST